MGVASSAGIGEVAREGGEVKVELALMSATGMSVDLLAKQILSISSPRQEGRDLKYEVGVIIV